LTKRKTIEMLEAIVGRKIPSDLKNLEDVRKNDPLVFNALVVTHEIGRRLILSRQK